ncbi:MAG: DNA repair protein RecO [Sedimentisphaerales bacterium]|nr:DNA repair protein RecO [Sedimentisphaerales bacterium]
MLIKDQAICIRTIDYAETSQVITLLTDTYGKIRAIAKGSKRPRSPFGGPIEVFSYGPAVILDKPHAQLGTLTEFQPRFEIISGLTRNLQAYNAAMLAAELVDRFTKDHDPHPGLYQLVLGFLRDVVSGPNPLPATIGFQLGLLRQVGMQLVLDGCANCRRPYSEDWPAYYFSSSANGLVCRDCEGSFPDRMMLGLEAVRGLQDQANLASAGPVARSVARILIDHITRILGHQLRTARQFLQGMACHGSSG